MIQEQIMTVNTTSISHNLHKKGKIRPSKNQRGKGRNHVGQKGSFGIFIKRGK